MKRTIMSMLGALAVAVSLGLFATPASAVTCAAVPGGTGDWPWGGATQRCGAATAGNAGNVAITLNNMPGSLTQGVPTKTARAILKNYPDNGSGAGTGARFWVFATQAEFNSFCTTLVPGVGGNWLKFGYTSAAECPAAPPSSVGGATYYFGSTSPNYPRARYAVIFTNVLSQPAYDGATVAYLTVHEAGHMLNASSEWRGLLGAASNVLASDSANFKQELNNDYNNFNLEAPQCPTLFGGSKDDRLLFICSNNGTGGSLNAAAGYTSAMNNEVVLKRAWRYFYVPAYETVKITIGGTVSVNDTLSIIITDSTVTGSPITVSSPVTVPGTTKAQIAADLITKINANAALDVRNIGAFQGAVPEEILLVSASRGFTDYSQNVGGSGPHTETMTSDKKQTTTWYPGNGEFFSEVFASNTTSKWTGTVSPEKPLITNAYFRCTKALLQSLMVYGQVPGRLAQGGDPASVMGWPPLDPGLTSCPTF